MSAEEAKVKSAEACWAAIEAACPILLREGGIEHVLKFVAVLLHGEVIPAPIIHLLLQPVAKLRSA